VRLSVLILSIDNTLPTGDIKDEPVVQLSHVYIYIYSLCKLLVIVEDSYCQVEHSTKINIINTVSNTRQLGSREIPSAIEPLSLHNVIRETVRHWPSQRSRGVATHHTHAQKHHIPEKYFAVNSPMTSVYTQNGNMLINNNFC